MYWESVDEGLGMSKQADRAEIFRTKMTAQSVKRRLGRALLPVWCVLFGFSPYGAAMAQTPQQISDDAARGDTVSWKVSVQSGGVLKKGGRLILALQGAVLDGWHVYSLKQLPGGPTPLRVALDSSDVATPDGAPTGSPPTKIHDPGFDLDTQFYSHAFALTVPVRLGSHVAAGQQLIPVSVRFQTCNDRVCQPSKTVHLSVPVTVRADG